MFTCGNLFLNILIRMRSKETISLLFEFECSNSNENRLNTYSNNSAGNISKIYWRKKFAFNIQTTSFQYMSYCCFMKCFEYSNNFDYRRFCSTRDMFGKRNFPEYLYSNTFKNRYLTNIRIRMKITQKPIRVDDSNITMRNSSNCYNDA